MSVHETSIRGEASSGGIGFAGLLAVLFIALKLTGYIEWSWLWVLSPIWISVAVGIGFLLVFLGFFWLTEMRPKRTRRIRL